MTEIFDATGTELGEGSLATLAVNAMSDDLFGMTDRILDQVMTFQHGPTVDDRTLIACGIK